jgi:hypothetical protein
MSNRDDRIKQLYERPRYHPYSKPHDNFPSPHHERNRAADYNEAQGRPANNRVATSDEQRNQFVENAHHDRAYDNLVSKTSWLQSGKATDKPDFDHSKNRPSMQRGKGNDWHTPVDPGTGNHRHDAPKGPFPKRPKG